MADETHHRDVNHTFADMKSDDPNPFVQMHKDNAAIAWRIHNAGMLLFCWCCFVFFVVLCCLCVCLVDVCVYVCIGYVFFVW